MTIHKICAPPITIKQWGSINNATDWSDAFSEYNAGCTATDGFGRAGPGKTVTYMTRMFYNDGIPNWGGEDYWNLTPKNPLAIHIENWDISGVTDLDALFSHRMAITGDIADWDVANIIQFSEMFSGNPVFNEPLNTWNMSSAKYTRWMFSETGAFNQPLDSWDMSSVEYAMAMFFEASAFNQPLNSWDVSAISEMNYFFCGAVAFNQPLYNWSLAETSDRFALASMFQSASSFNQDLSCWDVQHFGATAPSDFATDCPIDGTAKMPKWGQPPNTGCV